MDSVDLHAGATSPSEFYFVKGAFERILPMCDRVVLPAAGQGHPGGSSAISVAPRTIGWEEYRAIDGVHSQMSCEGLRVIAVAAGRRVPAAEMEAGIDAAKAAAASRRGGDARGDSEPQSPRWLRDTRGGALPASSSSSSSSSSGGDRGLVFLGLLGFMDPLRSSVPQAVRALQAARMRVIMITGDGKLTAAAIAKQAGILPLVMQGPEGTRELHRLALGLPPGLGAETNGAEN